MRVGQSTHWAGQKEKNMYANKIVKRTSAGAKSLTVVLRSLMIVVLCTCSIALAEMAQSPLFLETKLAPNIMFTLDDSGSMDYEVLPDNVSSASFTDTGATLSVAKFRSSAVNQIFYDPAVRYRPWQKADGTWYADSMPSAARNDPRNTATINLVDTGQTCNRYNVCTPNPYYAFYYKYNGGNTGTFSNYAISKIESGKNYAKAEARTDCVTLATECTYTEEIQNFANWYTYYRKRIFTAIAGTSQAFNGLDGNYRVGYGQINSASTTVDGVSTRTVQLGVRDFTGTAKTSWFAKLFASSASGYTPLRRAMDDVGQYFMRSDAKGPWAEFPGASQGTEYACRKSYHILMTDGYWTNQTGDAAYTAGATNADNNMAAPYGSSASNTLADVAMYYWKTDLRSNLANKVPITESDNANWQHVVQYTVGLGLDGTLNYPEDEAGLKAGTISWPVPTVSDNSDIRKIDDLWHAAVNGHGMYFNAKNPSEFLDALVKALSDIKVRKGAASTVALTSSRAEANGKAYVPGFESEIWLGHLKAYSVDVNGVMATTADWDAADMLPAWTSRNIVTWNGTAGVSFDWANLTTSQIAALGTEDVLKYLKGDDSKEKSKVGGKFRIRKTKLGDIVNSSPLYVAAGDRGYKGVVALPAGASEGTEDSYVTFVNGKVSRTKMLYVGANDGMLHGFDATTGAEKFAFVPNSVYSNLKSLSATDYAHKYFVDGYLSEGDAYLSGAWKTILLGSTGAGAKSVFAINITTPSSLGASSVMWEKSASGDNNMGYVLGQVELELMASGSWAAIHGNGYDSLNKHAVLYIRNAETGAVIKTIDTGVGSATEPNGLSAPVFVRNNKRQVIAAYAGDLLGNLWKFDLSSSDASNWSASKLFAADSTQPITTRPAIGVHPWGGYMLTFGTGKYHEDADRATVTSQSVYGIWDKPDSGAISAKTALQEQTLTAANAGTTSGATLTNTDIDWKTKRGWFIDLKLSTGERVIADPRIEGDLVWLTTLIPVNDPCSLGGESRLMGMNYATGGAITNIFDTNGDGLINGSDTGLSAINIGGAISDFRFLRVNDINKIIINRLDGTLDEVKTKVMGAPFRVWRLLTESY
jgi:type IV pilus assembly protein PilY1